jgi:hypothetical protein
VCVRKKEEMAGEGQFLDYHVKTRSVVDRVFIVFPEENPIEGIPIEDSEQVPMNDFMMFNCRIPLTLFKTEETGEVGAACQMLSYGKAGGIAEYKLNEIISIPLTIEVKESKESGKHASPIILNLPQAISYAFVEFPSDLTALLGLPKILHCVKFDVAGLRKKYGLSDAMLLQRGIDPAKCTWTTYAEMQLPEWALTDRMQDLINLVENNSRPVKVHCFSFTGLQQITIKRS